MPTPRIIAKEVFRLDIPAKQVIDLIPTPEGAAALVLGSTPDYRREHPSGASSAKLFAAADNEYHIVELALSGTVRTPVPRSRENFHELAKLPGGRWLLVRGRAKGDSDLNATVLGGGTPSRFHAGDGVQHVQISPDGTIWLGYFDEGVFGDVALGKAGLVAMDDRGAILFKYTDLHDQAADAPRIDDCYALNVASDQDVWICPYSDFPLVHLRDREVQGIWHDLDVAGSAGFATDGSRALFGSGYDEKDELRLIDLRTAKATRLRVRDESGGPLGAFQPIGRGPTLWLRELDPCRLFRIDMANLD